MSNGSLTGISPATARLSSNSLHWGFRGRDMAGGGGMPFWNGLIPSSCRTYSKIKIWKEITKFNYND